MDGESEEADLPLPEGIGEILGELLRKARRGRGGGSGRSVLICFLLYLVVAIDHTTNSRRSGACGRVWSFVACLGRFGHRPRSPFGTCVWGVLGEERTNMFLAISSRSD